GEEGAYPDERPQHEVTVAGFHIGKFPVTQALWKAVMKGENPSTFPGDDRPVEQVSWDDAQAFVKNLNDLTKSSRPPAHAYRLPTEAEWEYAAKGGSQRVGVTSSHPDTFNAFKYAGSDRLKDVGWFDGNSNNETKPVGLKYPNQLGIYDMSGNVWEWCEDDWHGKYDGAPDNGSAWIDSPRGSNRVHRGGSWLNGAQYCRAASRGRWPPGYRNRNLGFRLALSLQ
ncbi:MAG: formylglycine-generating enzyme family protein, partial [Saprospiraceae bacterium]